MLRPHLSNIAGAFCLVVLTVPALGQTAPGAPGPNNGQRSEPRNPSASTQRLQLFPPGRCRDTQAFVGVAQGEVGIASNGPLATRSGERGHVFTVGPNGCRVRIFVVPESDAPPRRQRPPARPFAEPFRN